MRPTYVFSSAYGRVLTAVTAVAAVAAVLAVAGDLPLRDVLTTALAGALVALVVWATLGRPAVEVSDGEVVLVNVTRTVRIPWPLLDRAEARWSLEVHTTDGRRWTAWAAPRGSAAGGAMRAARGRGTAEGDRLRWTLWAAPRAAGRAGPAGAAGGHEAQRVRRPGTAESVQAAVEERHAALLTAGHLDGARQRAADAGLRVVVTWNVPTIAGALTLSAAAVATRVV
nr:PH domain-containing protein [uncultured Actinotalea sp.]